ncbi:MAG TPA: exodeoxyribonuclease VII small subunit [Chloroflexia bacterium]|nr:exodeoxyribonuclease VII small subunit [Chloroflexia bacterium]
MDTANRQQKAEISKLNFEEAFERLNETAARLERGSLSLDESLALYEEGVLLSQHCEELLNNAQLRVSQVTPGGFESEEEADEDDEEDDDFI